MALAATSDRAGARPTERQARARFELVQARRIPPFRRRGLGGEATVAVQGRAMRPRPITWSRPRAGTSLTRACALVVTLAACPSAARAADFDAAHGTLQIAPDAVRVYRFEKADELIGSGLQLVKWSFAAGLGLDATPVSAGNLAPLLQSTDGADAIEGTGYLRLSLPGGVAVVDDALFASVSSGRLSVTLWARAEGGLPQLRVVYGAGALGDAFQHASVQAIRTGRETTDGWTELSTGPIDGMVWGAPIKAILVTGSPFSMSTTKGSIDALEIRRETGAPTPASACTQADVETTCGAAGECMYGHCVASSVVWGPLPPSAHREEIARRWIQIAGRFLGDRAATRAGRTTFATAARDLARYAVSSSQFHGGMARLVNGLRDNHTSYGAPPASFSAFAPQAQEGWSAGLHACFGVVEKDLLGGGRGFAVFRAGDAPATRVKLKVGDVVTKIDGMDPKSWVDLVYPRVAPELPNDADADWSWAAQTLSAMVTKRAKTLTLARCASATACNGTDRQELTVPVADVLFPQEAAGGLDVTDYFECSPRFHDAVDAPSSGANGNTPVDAQSKGGITYVQFDGFVSDPASATNDWSAKMSDVFFARPTSVVMDARLGQGGSSDNIAALVDLTRGSAEPIGAFDVIRGGWDDADPSGIFDAFASCTSGSGSLACWSAEILLANAADPPGGATKIAWLNTADVSANDFTPRMLQGRSKVRIFGPTHSSGAYGAITSLPGFLPGWMGGSVQYTDTRFAPTMAAMKTARWESGHGVVPEQSVAETVSDLLRDRDTILEAAAQWLSE